MSLTQDDRKAIVSYRLEKAETALEEAIKVSNIKLWNIAANRLYYALYYAASALLISEGLASHTHRGLISQIHLNYVKTGRLGENDGKLLRNMFKMRHEGDYEDFIDAAEEDISSALPKVRTLVGKIKGMIMNNMPESNN